MRLNRHARVHDDGRSILGGAPTRMIYLTEAAAGMLVDRTVRVTSAGTAALADRLLELGMADPLVEELPPFAGAGEMRGEGAGGGAGQEALLSYVIPVRDRPLALDRLLASIRAAQPWSGGDIGTAGEDAHSAGAGHAEIIVVDDCSDDPQAIADVAWEHDARLVRLPANLGPGGARNAGLAVVATPFVAFADSDVVVDAQTVPILLKHFADPKVAMAAPRIVGLADVRQTNWIGRYEDARSSLDLGSDPATVRPRSPVSWASTAFAVARVDALREGEGFDAGMRVGEDVDLVWRLVDRGWRVRYEPAARAGHEHRVSFGDWISRKAIYGTAAQPLAERHPHDIAPAVLAPWSVGVVAALLAQRRWSVPVALAISLVTAGRIAWKLRRNRHPLRLGVWLTANGVGGALGQAMSLMLRHWWPIAAIAAVFSRRARRAVAVAAVADVALRYRQNEAKLDPVRFGVARRLDDLAYGAGVWFSAIRGRSIAALKPDLRRHR